MPKNRKSFHDPTMSAIAPQFSPTTPSTFSTMPFQSHAMKFQNSFYNSDKNQSAKRKLYGKELSHQEDKQPKSVSRICHRFADKTSLQGVRFIEDAGRWYSRALWTLFFLVALGLSVWQLCFVFGEYLSYPVSTKINLGYDTLDFPSVTICNINPLRMSKLDDFPEMKEFVNSLSDNWVQDVSSDEFEYWLGGGSKSDQPAPSEGKPEPQPPPPPTETPDDITTQLETEQVTLTHQPDSESTDPPQSNNNDQQQTSQGNAPPRVRRFASEQYEKPSKEDRPPPLEGGHFGTGNYTDDFSIRENFTDLLGKTNLTTRQALGHDKEMAIVSCSFNGLKCSAENFTTVQSTDYGNCYVFNSPQLRNESLQSMYAGTKYGLSLVLYTQARDYLYGFTQGRGFRVVVHPFGTMPVPDYNSMAVSPGKATSIGIRLITINRLGEPYGTCAEPEAYELMYDHKYTTTACSATCEDRLIATRCNCVRPQFIQYVPLQDQDLPACDLDAEDCILDVRLSVQNKEAKCGCVLPCEEQTYQYAPSFHHWPTTDIAGNLINKVCERDDEGDDCNHFFDRTQDDDVRMQDILNLNFAKLMVSYMELNYESLREEPAYGISLFGADIGGVVGLWLGMSVLSALEVVDFAIQLCRYIYCRRLDNRKQSSSSDSSRPYASYPY